MAKSLKTLGSVFNLRYKKVLLLGSGALKIGEAGEFDYSGSQAAKAFREEGIKTVLVNPNIATFQTSRELVSRVYFLPVTTEFVEKVVAKERPDAILLGFGGQTALNCGLELASRGVFEKYGVQVLGTPIAAIEKTENRLAFRKFIKSLGLKVPDGHTCRSLAQAKALFSKIRFPVVVRAGYSLGGLGSGVVRTKKQLLRVAAKALTLSPQILIEEYLEHWKEVEYEVVRDGADNTATVCNMENLDPMGIHTGESIVVAPSQTLTNDEYHNLRKIAIRVVKNIPIIGECNIQFAISPKTFDYRIIEVNARLSRSSALASKATGYPLAYVAAKLALGKRLDEIPNRVTGVTTAFFEPALDYIVVKIPRWDFLKFGKGDEVIGSEMQSVGEVMAIGRSFEEAFQKGIRSLNVGYEGIISDGIKNAPRKPRFKKLLATPSRPYDIAYNLFFGQDLGKIQKETGIDAWFLQRIKTIVDFYKWMKNKKRLSRGTLLEAKKLGFSDRQIGEIFGRGSQAVRRLRKKGKIEPYVCQIDTLAGEFPAKTNYLYLSYHRQEHDIAPGAGRQVGIVGGGPYQIGSSVEFDWCALNCAQTAQKEGYKVVMVNCNPETVSTDYDMSDKLYFEELTPERLLDIVEFEKCPLIPSMGGQIPNTLAEKLRSKVRFLGNSPEIIDMVEDREKFSRLLDSLGIRQPKWARFQDKEEALSFAQKLGYPVLLRPSYVLSGSAMFVAYSKNQLINYLRRTNSIVTAEYPIVISKFEKRAKEVDFDAVAQNGEILFWALSEHVEHAGVHSGDSTLVLPSFSLTEGAVKAVKRAARKLAQRLGISGPFNIQFLIQENGRLQVLLIEANLRASRSFPFVSKVLGVNFIEVATKVILGKKAKKRKLARPAYFGVKVPHFSFTRLRRADPVLRVEMSSTGEVACFGETLYEAYLKALLATGVQLPKKGALVSLGDEFKEIMLPTVRQLWRLGFPIYATRNTHLYLQKNKVPSKFVYKVHERQRPNVVDVIRRKKVDLVINLSEPSSSPRELIKQKTDGYLIRRAAVDRNISLFTRETNAHFFADSLAFLSKSNPGLYAKPWDEYV